MNGFKSFSDKLRSLVPRGQIGKVVTRFAPEPGGFLHIGHAKAALISRGIASAFDGKMLLRFDDTNPQKEREEFVEAILEDLRRMGVSWDGLSFTSDYFQQLTDMCEEGIRKGFLFCDDTPEEQMRAERRDGLKSKNRELPTEQSLEIFEGMKKGKLKEFCVRAKIDFRNNNKCLRDPVVFRAVATNHGKTGDRFKVFPTYDFAVPLVDSLEQVTLATRSSEYTDRGPQYQWFLKQFGLPSIDILTFSRMNFVSTTLSKRNISSFISQKLVEGWDDPRLPTIRGLWRRGLRPEALNSFIMDQGGSKNSNLMEWDKLWTLNRQQLERNAPRLHAVSQNSSLAQLKGFEKLQFVKVESLPPQPPRFLGVSGEVRVETEDIRPLREGDRVVFLGLGIFELSSDTRDSLTFSHHPEDTRFSKLPKLSWVSSDPLLTTEVEVQEFGPLLIKRKPDENEEVVSLFNQNSKFTSSFFCEASVQNLTKGDIFQIVRRGLFVVDRKDAGGIWVVAIPDGRTHSMSLLTPAVDPKCLIKGLQLP